MLHAVHLMVFNKFKNRIKTSVTKNFEFHIRGRLKIMLRTLTSLP